MWSALVVAADPDVRQSLRLSLEADGAHVLGVGSFTAALAALDHAHYDVVVLVANGEAIVSDGVLHLGTCSVLPAPFAPERVRASAAEVLARAPPTPVYPAQLGAP